jgi:hypothetical protein
MTPGAAPPPSSVRRRFAAISYHIYYQRGAARGMAQNEQFM